MIERITHKSKTVSVKSRMSSCLSTELLAQDFLTHLKKSSIIDRDALKVDFECELGKGNFGMVYRGKLTLPSGKEELVAVKTHINATNRSKKRFLAEVVTME